MGTPFIVILKPKAEGSFCAFIIYSAYSGFSPHPPLRGTFSANFIVVTPHCGAHSLKFENPADEISATGSHRLGSLQEKPFGCHPEAGG